MPDIIRLLPDSVANQIAAGEVIQRPASAVKELMENAVDSGADRINVIVKDSGKTLIQVVDNGCGMSETDARMAFERHSTSKIRKADDLFAIQTMGFRGEALASVSAIANVELKTKRIEDETGTQIIISGSKLISQEPVGGSDGSNFSVKNLFFNVPARRKFLKSNTTELKHMINEFQRIALSYPDISFSLKNNNTDIYRLEKNNLRQRIVTLFGKNIKQNLISVNTETSIVKIKGFIGKPEFARKTTGEQFLSVNSRYMKHPYFHKAVILAYKKILPPETIPSYFIYFEVDPKTIDINIHPTKTEIKFEDESAVWQILYASVKEALGKFNIVPSLDFNMENAIEIPVSSRQKDVIPPPIDIDPEYNPFDEKKSKTGAKDNYRPARKIPDWEKLYTGFEKEEFQNKEFEASHKEEQQEIQTDENIYADSNLFQLKRKYILTPVKSGLMIIDQRRAHERILFERFRQSLESAKGIAQQSLFPVTVELNPVDYNIILGILNDIQILGFDIRDFGNNSIVVNGTPAYIENPDPKSLIEKIIEDYKNTPLSGGSEIKEKLALSVAKASAINHGKTLIIDEMRDMVDNLFACRTPNYTPDGRIIIIILSEDELGKRFK